MTDKVAEYRILLEHCKNSAQDQIIGEKKYSEASNADIGKYIENGGYAALKKALSMMQESIIEEVKKSGLVGRGGASFPTGLKWEMANKAIADQKYMICNADEGEPGTFKDKVLLDQDPHRVIEGMIICAFAINASIGYIYIKGEYVNTIKILKKAINDAKEAGYLGQNILGSPFSLEIKIFTGAGAYICGEETALFNSIEGKRGIPRIKPPYPTTNGLFQKPTVINNVETLANIPHIIQNGAAWFTGIGIKDSYGTKLISISGDVNRPGVYEIELGKYSLREIIEYLAGGIRGDKQIKAVLPGGASTSFLTGEKLDVIVDFRSLTLAGSSLGTGAIIVFDQTRDIPKVVAHLFDFYLEESCGNCIPCRLGTKEINDMLYGLIQPLSKDSPGIKFDAFSQTDGDYIKNMIEIGMCMKTLSKCGLGQASPNPLLSSLTLFEDEYKSLIQERQKEYSQLVLG